MSFVCLQERQKADVPPMSDLGGNRTLGWAGAALQMSPAASTNPIGRQQTKPARRQIGLLQTPTSTHRPSPWPLALCGNRLIETPLQQSSVRLECRPLCASNPRFKRPHPEMMQRMSHYRDGLVSPATGNGEKQTLRTKAQPRNGDFDHPLFQVGPGFLDLAHLST